MHAWKCFEERGRLRHTTTAATPHEIVSYVTLEQEEEGKQNVKQEQQIKQLVLDKSSRLLHVDGDLKWRFTSVDLPDDLLEVAMLRAVTGTIL